MLDRVAVLAATPIATLLTLLLELFLSFSVGKAKAELDTVVFIVDTMEVLDDSLSDFTTFESGRVSNMTIRIKWRGIPGEADLFAHTRRHVTADLG